MVKTPYTMLVAPAIDAMSVMSDLTTPEFETRVNTGRQRQKLPEELRSSRSTVVTSNRSDSKDLDMIVEDSCIPRVVIQNSPTRILEKSSRLPPTKMEQRNRGRILGDDPATKKPRSVKNRTVERTPRRRLVTPSTSPISLTSDLNTEFESGAKGGKSTVEPQQLPKELRRSLSTVITSNRSDSREARVLNNIGDVQRQGVSLPSPPQDELEEKTDASTNKVKYIMTKRRPRRMIVNPAAAAGTVVSDLTPPEFASGPISRVITLEQQLLAKETKKPFSPKVTKNRRNDLEEVEKILEQHEKALEKRSTPKLIHRSTAKKASKEKVNLGTSRVKDTPKKLFVNHDAGNMTVVSELTTPEFVPTTKTIKAAERIAQEFRKSLFTVITSNRTDLKGERLSNEDAHLLKNGHKIPLSPTEKMEGDGEFQQKSVSDAAPSPSQKKEPVRLEVMEGRNRGVLPAEVSATVASSVSELTSPHFVAAPKKDRPKIAKDTRPSLSTIVSSNYTDFKYKEDQHVVVQQETSPDSWHDLKAISFDESDDDHIIAPDTALSPDTTQSDLEILRPFGTVTTDKELYIMLAEQDDLKEFKELCKFSTGGDNLFSRMLRERTRIHMKRGMLSEIKKIPSHEDLYAQTHTNHKTPPMPDCNRRIYHYF